MVIANAIPFMVEQNDNTVLDLCFEENGSQKTLPLIQVVVGCGALSLLVV